MYSTRALWCLLQMQSSRDAAPQRLGYHLDGPTGTAGLAAADANSQSHSHTAAQAQAQAPARASTAPQGHPSSGISGHAALPAGAAPLAAPPAPRASTLPGSQGGGQTQDRTVADSCNRVPAQQVLGVPGVALQHGAAVSERAEMLPSLAEREAPACWVQRPVSKMRPLAELHFTSKVGPDAPPTPPPCYKVQLCCVVVCQHQEFTACDTYETSPHGRGRSTAMP